MNVHLVSYRLAGDREGWWRVVAAYWVRLNQGRLSWWEVDSDEYSAVYGVVEVKIEGVTL